MKDEGLYPRFIQDRVIEALGDSPIVLIHGPRQCGKTTLARQIGDLQGFTYLSFDDDVQREAAHSDPVGFVDDLPKRAILDEVQRVPELFTSLKAAIDKWREPGRFILTGSSNVLLVPKLADSLAGRMAILRLHPLSIAEITGEKSNFIRVLFKSAFKSGISGNRMGRILAERVAAGGYPPALARSTEKRRLAWYRDYTNTLIQKDIRDLSRISAMDALPRLLSLAASQTACLVNISELAAPFQVSRPTIREYVTLLSGIFLLEELPPWHSRQLGRLIKTPKMHLCDTGLACSLLGLDSEALWRDRATFGRILETFVFQELRRQGSWHDDKVIFSHFRDKDKAEVDIVIECAGLLAGVEVKASATVGGEDFRGLRKLRDVAKHKFSAGVVLYDGSSVVRFDDRLTAVPISRLWEKSS